MRSRHRDRIAEAHPVHQHLGALHHRNARGERRQHFRILRRDGAGDHDHIRTLDIAVGMTDGDRRPSCAKRCVAALA